MNYSQFENLEDIFEQFDDKEEFKKWALEIFGNDDMDRFNMLLSFFECYHDLKSAWKLLKLNGSIDVLNISNKTSIREVVDEIDKNNFSRIFIELDNKDYEDINLLDSYDAKYDVYIKYGNSAMDICSLEEFKNMRDTINYYKNLIDSSNLSPLEIITYAYDLIKSQEYNETTEDKSISRSIHSIIKNGKIVCAGYSKFLSQLLSEYKIDSYVISVYNEGDEEKQHVRLIIKVEDEKYKINALYAFDPTFDSAKNVCLCENDNGEYVLRSKDNPIKNTDKIIKKYDDTCLYLNFLVPLDEYRSVFDEDVIKPLDDSDDNFMDILNMIQNEHKDSEKKFNDLKLFIKLMYSVKLAEGYNIENIVEYINDLIFVNRLSSKDESALIKEVVEGIITNLDHMTV